MTESLVTQDLRLESERMVEEYRVKARERRKKATQLRKTPFHYEGVDLREELKKFARTKVLRPYLDLRRLPNLKVRFSPEGFGVGGRAYYGKRGRIILTISVDAHLSEVLETLLHELVHHATPHDAHHGSQFIGRLNNAARELWGIFVEDTYKVDRGGRKNRAYAIDALLCKQLKEKLAGVPTTSVLATAAGA